MNTIGELMNELRDSGASCLWMNMMCRRADPDGLAALKQLSLTEGHVAYFCLSIAGTIREYLAGATSEDHYNSVSEEGRQFLEQVYEKVKDKGISKESVCVPISFVDMAVQAGVVKVEDGMVSLTDSGRAVVEKLTGSE